jgi:hypothetical protein
MTNTLAVVIVCGTWVQSDTCHSLILQQPRDGGMHT